MQNSHLHGRDSRRFSETGLCSAEYYAAYAQKRVVDIDGTLVNFSMQFSWLAVYCATVSLGEKVICIDGALANFSCHDFDYCNGSSCSFHIQLHYVRKIVRKWFQKRCFLLSGGTFERDHFKGHFWKPF